MWFSLEKYYASTSKAYTMELKLQLQSLQKGGILVTNFVLNVKNFSNQLMATTVSVSENDLIVCIFGNVGFDFNLFVAFMNMNTTMNAIELTIEEVFNNLLYEHMLEEQAKIVDLNVMQANMAKLQLQKSNNSQDTSDGSSSEG